MERAGGHGGGDGAVTDQSDPSDRPLALSLLKLARPHQWAKSAFVLVGPLYAIQDRESFDLARIAWAVGLAAVVFALASSGCYVFNDLADAERDRAHPRKRRRPIASGAVNPGQARVFGVALILAAGLGVFAMPEGPRLLVGVLLFLHVANVTVYSAAIKRRVIADVMSLSMGFVLRVMAGCAAVEIAPTTWLLNVTFFLSMLLAFGKRLGERKTMGSDEDAASVRLVQSKYSEALLRMLVVVTAVATLLTYAGYVNTREDEYMLGFNLLWITLLPATYGVLRAITLLEQGRYDDPTELALRDKPFMAAGLAFGLITVGLLAARSLEVFKPAG